MSAEPEGPFGEYAPSRHARRFRTTGVPRASKRRMSAGRKAWYAVIVAVARAFLWLTWTTCRVTAVRGAEHLEPARRKGAPAVIVYWHQMHLFCAWLLAQQARAGLPLAVLTSPSVSGEVPAAIISRWGMRPVRGSSTRSAGEALRDMHAVIAKDGQSLVVTADGPKGPRHEFKPGALLLARMSKAPVIPMAYAASRCTRWGSWDEFIVPWPFSRVAVVVGEPWTAPPGFSMADLPAAARNMQQRLDELAGQAAELLRR
jgi:lysophospholipid acyltransferase (LPLAT)-like uncharacterized protein